MNILNTKLKTAAASLAVVFAIGVGLSAPNLVNADDTEIFFGGAKTANLMFVLDESGSMSFKDADADDDTLIVDQWYQNQRGTRVDARSKLPTLAYDDTSSKARFPTLQVCVDYRSYGCRDWVDYTPYRTQNDLKDWKVDVTTILEKDYYYRWIHIDNRMTRLKEALYIFFTSEKTKDNNQIGMMSYSSGRKNVTILHENVRRLDKETGGKTHREWLIEKIYDLHPSFGTPTAEGYYQATQYMAGAYTQNGKAHPSPILEGACGYNSSILLLTDGLPTVFGSGTYADIDKVIDSCDASTSGNQNSTNNGKQCTEKLSAHYFVNDVKSNFPGSTLQTSTVAFALNDTIATDFLKKTASMIDGKKLFFEPTNVESLVRSFDESLNAVQDTTSFVAPSIPLSQTNRLRHSNNLYMGMFKPGVNETWFGNLKKYQLSEGKIVDKDGALAVNTETGTFLEDSISFWGDVKDGNKVEKGGAAPYISVGPNPKVYTNLNSNNLNQLTVDFIESYKSSNESEADFHDRLFGNNPTLDQKDISDVDIDKYYTWIRNRSTALEGADLSQLDLTDDSIDTANGELGRFGDVLHSKPEILEYEGEGAPSVAFLATNQGYLHAVNVETGQELWAFFPRQMMKNVPVWSANAILDYEKESRTYGLDGHITLHTEKDESGEEKHYLYVGSRRGGSYVYALDITNPDKPSMMFTVGDQFEFSKSELGYDTNNDTEVRVEIPNLGQSWSKAFVVKMHSSNTQGFEKRLVISGGYDPYYDNRANAINPLSNAIKGDGIYSIPYKTGNGYDVIANESDIYNSFASDLTFIDLNNDSILDHIYAADVAGKVYRVDFTKNSTSTNVEVLADVSSTDPDGPYRFYSKPDVAFAAYAGVPFAVVNLGSGHRANPKAQTTSDRYYAFFDFEITGEETSGDNDPIGVASLEDVTNVMTDPETGEVRFKTIDDFYTEDHVKKGWYFNLSENEKVLSGSSTVQYTTFFTTYIPGPPGCGVTSGVNRLYGIGLLDGGAGVDLFKTGDIADISDRFRNLDFVGITPGSTLIFPTDVDIGLLVGTQNICSGEDCDFFKSAARTVKWKQKE